MSNTSLEDANQVIDWIKSNQGFWNSDLLEIKESKLGGIGVFAKQDIEPTLKPELLLRLPKESILSAQKSSIANLIYEEKLEGALGLIIAFIYEKHFGESSPWYQYIKTIVYKDNKDELILPPSLWTQKQKSLLKGSELEIMGALDDEENKSAYETACTFALNQHEISSSIPIPWELDIENKDDRDIFLKYKSFIAISHAIASRDFEIDAFHQVALVPGADLFNHTNKPHVRFESIFDVCDMCGSAGHCDCIESEDEEGDEMEESEEGEVDEEMSDDDGNNEQQDEHDEGDEDDEDEKKDDEENEDSDLELLENSDDQDEDSEPEDSDVEENRPIDDAMIAKIEAALQREKDEETKQKEEEQNQDPDQKSLILESDAGGKILPDECCDIVLMKTVSKGEEIFNTYGDFNNSILLSKYGFVIPDNSEESIGLGIQFLKIKKANKKLYAKQFEWWENEGYQMTREFFNVKKNSCCDDDDCDDAHSDDGCQDDCCTDGPNGHGHDDGHDDALEQEIPNWTLEVSIDSQGEPSPLTYALCKLLSLNKLKLSKFLKNPEKINIQMLTTNGSKAFKILNEVVELRFNQYDRDIKYEKYLNGKNYREKIAAQLVLHEKNIIQKALKNISKRT